MAGPKKENCLLKISGNDHKKKNPQSSSCSLFFLHHQNILDIHFDFQFSSCVVILVRKVATMNYPSPSTLSVQDRLLTVDSQIENILANMTTLGVNAMANRSPIILEIMQDRYLSLKSERNFLSYLLYSPLMQTTSATVIVEVANDDLDKIQDVIDKGVIVHKINPILMGLEVVLIPLLIKAVVKFRLLPVVKEFQIKTDTYSINYHSSEGLVIAFANSSLSEMRTHLQSEYDEVIAAAGNIPSNMITGLLSSMTQQPQQQEDGGSTTAAVGAAASSSLVAASSSTDIGK